MLAAAALNFGGLSTVLTYAMQPLHIALCKAPVIAEMIAENLL